MTKKLVVASLFVFLGSLTSLAFGQSQKAGSSVKESNVNTVCHIDPPF